MPPSWRLLGFTSPLFSRSRDGCCRGATELPLAEREAGVVSV